MLELPLLLLYVPIGHGVHDACEVMGLKVPAGHKLQDPERSIENLPAAHGMQAEYAKLPVTPLYFPASQD